MNIRLLLAELISQSGLLGRERLLEDDPKRKQTIEYAQSRVDFLKGEIIEEFDRLQSHIY